LAGPSWEFAPPVKHSPSRRHPVWNPLLANGYVLAHQKDGSGGGGGGGSKTHAGKLCSLARPWSASATRSKRVSLSSDNALRLSMSIPLVSASWRRTLAASSRSWTVG
jgi:hypothetical protein